MYTGFPLQQVMVAGDGENDLPLFEITKFGARGVLVSNACARLKNILRGSDAPPTVKQASECNAGGVLEGLASHFRHLGYTHRAADENYLVDFGGRDSVGAAGAAWDVGAAGAAGACAVQGKSAAVTAVSEEEAAAMGAVRWVDRVPSSTSEVDGAGGNAGSNGNAGAGSGEGAAGESVSTSATRDALQEPEAAAMPKDAAEGESKPGGQVGEVVAGPAGTACSVSSQANGVPTDSGGVGGGGGVEDDAGTSKMVSAWEEWLTEGLGSGVKGLGQKLRGGQELLSQGLRSVHRGLYPPAADASRSPAREETHTHKQFVARVSSAQDLAQAVNLLEQRVESIVEAVEGSLVSAPAAEGATQDGPLHP